MRSPSLPPSDPGSPTDSASASDVDEGFYDGPDTPATTVSDPYDLDDVDPTLWDLSMSDAMVATSSPRPSLSLEAQALSSYTMRRRQRQALSSGSGYAYRRVSSKFFALWGRPIESLQSQKRINMRGFRVGII
ncbi:hypothetical protein LTR67_004687 [Exophiala xenobiotica]